jgi:hypothetical protein
LLLSRFFLPEAATHASTCYSPVVLLSPYVPLAPDRSQQSRRLVARDSRKRSRQCLRLNRCSPTCPPAEKHIICE